MLIIVAALVATVANTTIQSGQCWALGLATSWDHAFNVVSLLNFRHAPVRGLGGGSGDTRGLVRVFHALERAGGFVFNCVLEITFDPDGGSIAQ